MISILLATRNPNKEYFKLAVQSVLNQTYKDFELLIGFNDCEILIPKVHDPRIRIFKYKEKGKAKTLNNLLKEAKGDWIALQDDDDVWYKDKLEIQMNVKNEDVIGTKIKYINEKGETIGQPKLKTSYVDIIEQSFKGINQIANTSAIFKREDALDVNGWNIYLDGIEDFDFWLKLMLKGCTFVNVDKYLVGHRIHDKSNFNTKIHDIKGLLESHGL